MTELSFWVHYPFKNSCRTKCWRSQRHN